MGLFIIIASIITAGLHSIIANSQEAPITDKVTYPRAKQYERKKHWWYVQCGISHE